MKSLVRHIKRFWLPFCGACVCALLALVSPRPKIGTSLVIGYFDRQEHTFTIAVDSYASLTVISVLTVLSLVGFLTNENRRSRWASIFGVIILAVVLGNKVRDLANGYLEPGDGLRPLDYAAFGAVATAVALGLIFLWPRQGDSKSRQMITAHFLLGGLLAGMLFISSFDVHPEWEEPASSIYRVYGFLLTLFGGAVGLALILKSGVLLIIRCHGRRSQTSPNPIV